MTAVWVCAVVTASSAFVSLGFAVAAAVSSRSVTGSPAQYALSRSIALAAVSVLALVNRSHSSILVIALALVIVQALDAVIGITMRDSRKTFGPAALGSLNLLAMIWLLA
jgi:hypothetical protein